MVHFENDITLISSFKIDQDIASLNRFYISRNNLRLEMKSIPFSKGTMFNKILSPHTVQNDFYWQNNTQNKNVSSQKLPVTKWSSDEYVNTI